jgi:hypothetical protein
MAESHREASPNTRAIPEPACRQYLSFAPRMPGRQTCLLETSALLAECGFDWSVDGLRIWFSNNRDKFIPPPSP